MSVAFDATRRVKSDADQLMLFVRRAFRLRHLVKDVAVTPQQFRDCLRRLQRLGAHHGVESHSTAASLLAFLPNVSLRVVVATHYSVAVDGFLCIPHDFDERTVED